MIIEPSRPKLIVSLNIDAIWCSPFLCQFLISGGVGCLSYKRPKKLTVSTSGNDIRGNTTIFTYESLTQSVCKHL